LYDAGRETVAALGQFGVAFARSSDLFISFVGYDLDGGILADIERDIAEMVTGLAVSVLNAG
jgi:hypothetical protein